MGNWNSHQITQVDHVVQPTDSMQALSDNLLTLSKHLINRIDSIWAARQQAAYFNALSSTPEANSHAGCALQRRCLQARSAATFPPSVFYAAVRLGHVPGIYTSWRP